MSDHDFSRACSARLTERERECLMLLSRGFMTKNISWALGISVPTVELHIRNARRRLDARTATEAVVRAIAMDIIPLEAPHQYEHRQQ